MDKCKIILNYILTFLQYFIVIILLLESIIFMLYICYIFYCYSKSNIYNNRIIIPFICYLLFYFIPYLSLSICNICYIKDFTNMKFKNFILSFNNFFRFIELILIPIIINYSQKYLLFNIKEIFNYKITILLISLIIQPILIILYFLINKKNKINILKNENNLQTINENIIINNDVITIKINI